MKSSINHFFRVIWSDVLNTWIAVSELTKAKGKCSLRSSKAAQTAISDNNAGNWSFHQALLKPIVFAVACCYSLNALANPAIPNPVSVTALKIPANNIVIDGRTATQISVNGSTTNITTASISGTTGFNSFATFVLNQGNTANLFLPQGAANLVNIVRNSQTIINGVVNGYKNGSIGGNVFFADPYGVVVGSAGAINVGSLTISTPSGAFLDQLIAPNGVIDATSTTRLLTNNYPISPDGLISIRGTINAPDGISLLGQNVNVSGLLNTGPDAAKQIALFESSVNTTGVGQGSALVEHNGTIEIVAQNAVEISGALYADGAPGQNAGSIMVTTVGGNINVDNSAVLSAKGRGVNSSGGQITVYAGTNINVGIVGTLPSDVAGAVTANGPQFNASAGSSGDGGTIETSAIGTANLHGGIFDASASNGKAGSWIVDPAAIVIDGSGVNPSIFTNGTNEILTASNSITIASTGEINTRNVGQAAINANTADSAVSTGNSGAVTLTAPNITVNGTIDAHATGSYTPGDITLTASDINSSFLLAGGFATASTGIDISGKVLGGNISFLASSSAISSYTDGTQAMLSSVAGDVASNLLGIGVGVVSGDAQAYVKIHAGANITATGNVALDAASIATADDSIINLGFLSANPSSKVAIPAVVYGNVKAVSIAQIESGASVTSGGALTVRAHNTATLKVSTTTASTTTPVDLSVAYGTADVQSTAQIDSGAAVSANSVRIVALNQNMFSITASNYVLGTGAAGLVFAFADGLKSSATALEGASLNLGGNLQVEADSLTTQDVVTAATTVGASALVRPFTAAATQAASYIETKLGKSPSPISQNTTTPKIGSALALTLNDNQTATAKIAAVQDPASVTTAAAPVITAGGTVAIVAQVLDTGAKSSGSSGVNSPSASEATAANPSATYSLSAGVAVAVRNLTADAEVGSGVVITASSIGVYASDSLPLSITWLTDLTALGSSSTWSTPSQAFTDITSHLNGNLGVCADIATSCANATGDATNVGFAGSVNYFALTGNTTAWVGQGAKLTSTAAGSATLSGWSTQLDSGDDASLGVNNGTARTQAFNAQVSVQAVNTVQTIDIGGNFSVMMNGTGGASSSATTVGGAVNYINYNDTTLAGIGSDAIIDTSGALSVSATSNDYLISVSPTSGRGGAIAGAGIMGWTIVNDKTHASISNTASVSAAAIAINVAESLNIWTIAGAIEAGNQAGVGIGLALNNVTSDTQAFIGNNSIDDLSAAYSGAAPAAGFTTGSLDVESSTTGRVVAVAVAGTLAKSSATDPNVAPASAAGTGGTTGTGSTASDTLLATFETDLAAVPTPAPLPSKPTFSLAASGSVAGNMLSLKTLSHIDGTSASSPVNITYAAPSFTLPAGTASDFVTVGALRDTYMVTGAGAAAVVSANSSSSQSSAAVGGTVAFEQSTDQTSATINNANMRAFKNLTVQALNAGQNINVGVDFAANTTNSGDSNYAAAGSVSLAQINDGVLALINDSTITGDSTTGSGVNVIAYDRTDIGMGGGSLYYGGKGGGSIAVSMLLLGNPASGNAVGANISGSSISNYDALGVTAVNSDRVIIGAATGGGGSSANGFSGSIVYDDISRTTNASIGSDVSGIASIIHTTSDISVTASGGDQVALDAIIATAGAPADSSGIDFTAAAAGQNLGPGAAIIAIAGVVQIGKNNVGMSLVDNTVSDTMQAQISNTTVTSDAGAVNLTANNATTILGLSAGVGVASGTLAGLGSSTVNNINDTTTAQIGDATVASSLATQLSASSLTVNATDTSSIQAFAGNVAVNTNGSAGGAALSVNTIGDQSIADVSNYELNITRTMAISASSTGTIQSVAASGAVAGGSLAFSGSATTNQINNNIDAYMTGSSLNDPSVFNTPSLTNTLSINASDTSTIESLAGSVAASSKTGVGVALALNRIGGGARGENVTAYIDGGKIDATDVTVSAQSSAVIKTLSAGVAVSGQVSAAGSLSTNLIDANVTADIVNGAQVTALDNVAVLADNTDTISVIAGAAGIGASTAGVGLSVVVNDIGGTTQAYVSGAASKVDALGQSAGDTVTVYSGTLATPVDIGAVQAPAATTPNLTETTTAVTGLAIVATSHQAVNTDAVSLGVSDALGVSIVAVVNVMGGQTRAYIDSASIDTQLPNSSALPSVDITASSHSYDANFVVGAAGSGGVGASGAMSVNTMNRSTDAYITSATLGGLDATSVATVGAVTVKSIASQDSAAIVVGFAVGAAGAGAATGIVNQFGADTEAYVNNGTLTATSLNVSADSNNGYNALAGGVAAGGGLGVAGTFVVADSNDTTKAYIGNINRATTLALTGALNVAATTENTYNSIVASGAGAGGAAIAGMVDVTMLNNTTSAGLFDVTVGASATPVGDVNVSAVEVITVKPYAGALAAGGAAGVGAGANVVMVQSNVMGEIVNSQITSGGTVLLSANSSKDIEAVTATLGAGGSAGMGAAIALILVGNGNSGNAMSDLSGSLSSVGSFSSAAAQSNSDSSLSATEQSNINNQTNFNLTGAINNGNSDGVSASIDVDSNIHAAVVGVSASGTVSTSNIAGAAGLGGLVGLGGGVGYTRIYDNISASNWGTVTASQIAVTASMANGSGAAASVTAYAGGAGAVGLSAAVADATISNTVTANVGGVLTGDGSGNGSQLFVQAADSSSVSATAGGVSVGAAAVGVVLAYGTKSSTVKASLLPVSIGSLNNGVPQNTYNTISVMASDAGSVSASAMGAAGGLLSGTGADSEATDTATVTAEAGGTITLGAGLAVNGLTVSALTVAASDTPNVNATAKGVSVGAAAVGASLATATAAPVVKAEIVDGTIFQGASGSIVPGASAPGVFVMATADYNQGGYAVSANAFAGSGGALIGVDATSATAQDNANVSALIGNNVSLPNRDVIIKAVNDSNQSATSTGVAVGFVAFGADNSSASADGSTTAQLGSGTITEVGRKFSGALTIEAIGSDTNNASAIAGSGGVLAGNASRASTDDSATTMAKILGNTSGATINGSSFNIQAAHTDNYEASANSINAAEVGASGANTSNNGSATTLAMIGDNVTLNAAGTITGTAYNSFNNLGGGATGAGGGVLSGAAASGSATLNGTASVTLGDNVQLNAGTDAVQNPGAIYLASNTSLGGSDQSSLNTGGAIAGAAVSASLNATLTNSISTGANDRLFSFGNVDLGNWAIVNASTSALVNTWGLAAVGSASASSDITVNQSVFVGQNTKITGIGNVNLTAGADPSGSWNTSLLDSAYAEGYVRGLIAIPLASASNNLTSNASLTISTGAQIISGQNTTIGAYQGRLTPQVDATGHGYELGFIPVTDGSSSANTTTTSTLTDNGTVTAGAYHNLTITIADCRDVAGVYCSQVSQISGMPVLSSWNPAFDPQAYLQLNYPGSITSALGTLLLSNTGSVFSTQVSATPVGAITLGGLAASGGTVTVNADKIIGSGTITSYGDPSITVNNYSADYLILNNASIPNLPGAQIIYTGAAGKAQALAAGLTLNTIGTGSAPTITINEAFAGAGYAPALILQSGEIDNLGGLISITNASGSLLQSSTNNAQQVVINVPNGAYVLAPANGIANLGESPAALWNDSMNWPGGNPDSTTMNVIGSTSPVTPANLAIQYVANAMFNVNGQYTNAQDFSQALIGTAGQSTSLASNQFYTYSFNNGSSSFSTKTGSVLFFADSTCQASGCGGTNNWQYAANISPIGASVSTNGWNTNSFVFPSVGIVPLTTTLTNYPAATAGVSNINAAQIIVNAQYIDISGQLNAGVPTNVSLTLPSSLTTPGGALTIDAYNYSHNLTTQSLFTLYRDNVTQSLFTTPTAANTTDTYTAIAQYNAATNQIVLNNVNASSTGASIILNGGILSTTTLGDIHINAGLGDVNVNNQTGIPLVVSNVNVGNAAIGTPSTVEITDTLQSLVGNIDNHWLYSYTPGGTLTVYNGTAATAAWALPQVSNTPGGSVTTYTPVSGLVWQWTDNATLSRAYTLKNGMMSTLGNWVWDMPAGSPNNPWTASTGTALVQAQTPVFTEKVSGGVTNTIYDFIAYHGCGGSVGSSCNFDFAQNGYDVIKNADGTYSTGGPAAIWSYIYPTAAWLTLTNSVKADNPIKIDFSGNSTGLLNIASNAPVTLAGQITNPNGSTTISSLGAINEISGGSLSSGDLTLNTHSAIAGIGQADKPLIATLSTGASVNAQGGRDGVYLDFNSGALIGQVIAGTQQKGYGDVVITTAGDMLAQTGNNLILGKNITLASPLGAVGIVGTATTAASPISVAAGGVVNVSALNDIAITQISGDMNVGSIASTAGNVAVNVVNGALLNAAGQTSAQTLSDAQIQQVWQTLHLTTADGANQSIVDTTVTPLYLQYWRLINNGTVANGVFTLNSPTVAIYTPLAAAALGITAPTTTQVQSYANGLYQNVTTALINIIDTSTIIVNGTPVTTTVTTPLSSLADFQTYNKDFGSNFAANYAGQLQTLAAKAVWTDAQLSNAINRTALAPSQGSVGNANPNISGRELSLTASNIGQLSSPVTINLSDLKNGNLNSDQQKALAAAFAPGDVLPVDANGNVVTLYSSALAGFQIAQVAPFFVASPGNLTASSSGVAYVQSTLPNMTIASLTAGGNVILAAPQSILSAGTVATQISTTGDLTLTAGSGNLGSAADPLTFQLKGGKLNAASAGQNAWLQTLTGDMTIGRVYALDTASLQAQGSILSSLPGVAISANDIVLNAGWNVGSAASYLSVQDGQSGSLTGSAGGSAWIYDATTPLQRVSFTTLNDLTVTVQNDLTALSLVAVNGNVVAASGGNANLASITAGNGSLTLTSAGTLTVGSESSSGDISNIATGNLLAGTVNSTQGSVLLSSSGGTLGVTTLTSGLGATLASSGDLSGGTLNMNGGDAAITSIHGNVTLANLTDTGNAMVSANGDLTVSNQLIASGTVQMTAGGNLQFGTLQGGGNVALNSMGNQSGTTLTSTGGAISNTSGGTLSITTVNSNGNVAMTSADNLLADSVSSTQGSVSLNSTGGTLGVTTLTSGLGATLSSNGDLTGDTLNVDGGDALITSIHGNVTLASLTDRGNTTVNASGDLLLTQLLSATGYISLAAGGALNESANASIQSVNGKIAAATGTLVMGSRAGIMAAGKIDLVTTAGDMTLGALNSTLGSGQAVSLASAGAIAGNGDRQTNITAAGAQASLTANADIGGASLPLLTNVPVLDAISTTGGIWLHNLSDMTSNTILASGAVGLTVEGNLQFGTVHGGSDVALNSTGNQSGTMLTSTGGAISDTSGGTLSITTVNGKGDVAMTAAGNLLANSVTSTQGSVSLSSTGGTLAVTTLTSGLGATLASSGDLNVGTLNVNGGDASITSSNGKVTLASLTDTGNTTVSANGDLAVSNQLMASGKVNMTTGGNLQFATLQGGGDVALASIGNQSGTTLTSTGGTISDSSGGALTVATVNGNGNVGLTAGGNLQANTVTSTTGSVSLNSSGGTLDVMTLASGLGASLSARDTLQINSVQVATALNLSAANMQVNVKQSATGGGQPLQLNMTGYRGGIANYVNMHISPIADVIINQLFADNATLTADVGNVSIVNGYMPGILSLTTPFMSLYQNNRNPSLLPVDIQLYQPSAQFGFDLSGKNLTTDSYVLNYGVGSMVNVVNYSLGHSLAKLNVNGVSSVIDVGANQQLSAELLVMSPQTMLFAQPDWWNNTFLTVSPYGGVSRYEVVTELILGD